MIKIFYRNYLKHTLKLLDLKKSADYEYACKKILLKHGYDIIDFNKIDLEKWDTEVDPYLKRVRELGYNLQSY